LTPKESGIAWFFEEIPFSYLQINVVSRFCHHKCSPLNEKA